MLFPIEIICEIAAAANDWRTIVRMAGTCRELRKKLSSYHWNAMFVPASKKSAVGVLTTFMFNNIDMLRLADSQGFHALGTRVAEIFNSSSGVVSLRTNSMFLMTGMEGVARRRKFDKLLFDIKYSRKKHMIGRSNVHSFDMLHGFAWVSLTGDNVGIMNEYAAYAARDCGVIEFIGMPPCENPMPEIYLSDYESDCEIIISCESFRLRRSKVYIGADLSYPKVKYVELDQDSMMVICADFRIIFPNATTNAPDRIHILTNTMYQNMKNDDCSMFDYVLRQDIPRPPFTDFELGIIADYHVEPLIYDEDDYDRICRYINMGSEDEGEDEHVDIDSVSDLSIDSGEEELAEDIEFNF